MSSQDVIYRRLFRHSRMLRDLLACVMDATFVDSLEGRREGHKEGHKEGQAALLKRQLSRKFGPLSEALVQRIRQGSLSELETWSLNFVEADSLEQVFAPEHPDGAVS